MEKILVPTDFTNTAEAGLKLATEIARRTGAVISLVNFTKHPFGRTFSATADISKKVDTEAEIFTLELLRANKQKLENLAAQYSSADVEIEYAIVDDELKDGIDDYLNKELVDLVVMGTSGEETVEEAFTGNHTEQVISVSSCPVLSVRDGFNADHMQRIVLAVSRIEEEKILIGLNTLRQLAECFNAHVYLVHVRETSSDSDEELFEYFTHMATTAGFQDYSIMILNGDDVTNEVVSFARQNQAGLIAIIKSTKDGLFRIFSNYLSNRLVKEVGRPVFTFNLANTLKGN